MHCLGDRVLQPEILDSLSPEQAHASLADLVRINRQWGGHSALKALLRMAGAGDAFTLLDVGAASGDMGERIREWHPQARVTSLDYLASHLAHARGDRVAADAFRLPFRGAAFDYTFCSLFLHHFTEAQIVDLLSELGRVARRAVLVLDLERNPVPYYFMAWSGPVLGWDPVTVHDGTISVEAGFKRSELEELAIQAGLTRVRARVWRPAFRIGLVGECRGEGDQVFSRLPTITR